MPSKSTPMTRKLPQPTGRLVPAPQPDASISEPPLVKRVTVGRSQFGFVQTDNTPKS